MLFMSYLLSIQGGPKKLSRQSNCQR